MSELLEEETGTTRVAAISGPNLSHDIVAARPTVLMIAARSADVAEQVGCVLTGPAVRTQVSTDLVGVELAGSLKNVVAIAAGIAAGLDLGDNARAAIVAAGLCEIQRLGVRLGAQAETFTGLAGIGDLFLTATSENSRNHMVGVEIGRGACLNDVAVRLGRMRETAEGIHTVRACRALAHTHRVVLPLADAVYRVLFEDADPRTHLVGALSGA
jgi:glycerol-3-phosphate dehydrogenase (NAD(P)+)